VLHNAKVALPNHTRIQCRKRVSSLSCLLFVHIGLSKLFLGLTHLCIVSVLFTAMVADVLCDVCGKAGKDFTNARGKKGCVSCICGMRYYCSRKCQNKDWKEHKEECHLYPEYKFMTVHLGYTKVEAALELKGEHLRQVKLH